MHRSARTAVASLVVLGVLVPPPNAAGLAPAAFLASTPPVSLGHLGETLGDLWRWLAIPKPQEGCGSDPNGHCASRSVPVTPQSGCGTDPNGHCTSTPRRARPQSGCGSDPMGGGCAANLPARIQHHGRS
jgi:hypothetical protein